MTDKTKKRPNYDDITDCNQWMDERHEPNLVSVIVPTYNRAVMISSTLESVFQQSYRPIELIVVDDGSTDETLSIVDRWRKSNGNESNDFRINILSQTHSGGSAARNLGLINSTGEFIQYLDSDDLLSPHKIGNQASLLERLPQWTTVFGDWRSFSRQNNQWKISEAKERFDSGNALYEWISTNNFIPPHGLLWKRKTVSQLGPWDEKLKCEQDGDYMFRFLFMGGELAHCADSWVYYRKHLNSPSVRTAFSPSHAESRLYALERLTNSLENRGLLDKYSSAISQRYHFLALRWAPFNQKYSRVATKLSRHYSLNGKLPFKEKHSVLSLLLGPYFKRKLARLIKGNNEASNSPLTHHETLDRIEDVFRMDMHESR